MEVLSWVECTPWKPIGGVKTRHHSFATVLGRKGGDYTFLWAPYYWKGEWMAHIGFMHMLEERKFQPTF
jgi:hypothetical protein